jgi:hypothetical protein
MITSLLLKDITRIVLPLDYTLYNKYAFTALNLNIKNNSIL